MACFETLLTSVCSTVTRLGRAGRVRCLLWLCGAWLACVAPALHATTYANAATTFSWINATASTQIIGYNTTPYKFIGSAGCGSTPPAIDDTLSGIIPIGFNFVFGDKSFDAVRVQSNGRIQMVSTTIPLDNTTCGYGSPVTQLPIPNAGLNYTMRIYGADLDPTLKADKPTWTTNCISRTGANACFVSVDIIGTVPGTRKFVVTWSNVPEWTTSNSATGIYNVQIVLLENGNFVYQYGSDVPGANNTQGQIAWQISMTDYEAPSAGYPVPNTAILFFVPHPVVEYVMEQAAWSGAGAVLDTSGNGRHGTPVGAAQTTAGGQVCRGVDVPAIGTNGISSGIGVPSIGNAGTIAFWYQAKTAWSGAGTQDVQLFDATTVSGQWFFLTRRGGNGGNAGKLRFVVTDSAGTDQVVETAALAVAAGTFKHIAVTWNFNNLVIPGGNNDRLRIYVDGVLQQATTFTSSTLTLSPTIGSLNIGGTRAGIVGQRGTSTSADAVLDEFRAYNFEASAATVVTIRDQNASGCLSHYAVSTPAAGLSCQSSTVTITPHTTAHAAYANNALITLSTSDGTGDWVLQNGHGVLTAGAANTGAATYLFSSESQVVLSLTHPATGTVTLGVTDGTYSAQENTPIVVTTCAAGKFIACEVTTPRCTPVVGSVAYANLYTKLADTAFKLDLSALKIDGSVDTAFAGTIAVNLLASSAAPTAFTGTTNCPTSPTATIALGNVTLASGRPSVAGVAVIATAFSAVAPKYSAYPDVRVQFVCTSPTCSPAATTCSPDAFTVRPKYFTVTSSNATADSAAGASASNTPSVKTGVAFTLTADATTKGYFGTPSVAVSMAEWPGAPAGGRAAPGVGTVSGAFTTAASIGTGNGATGSFTYDEVGYFRLKAGGITDAAYAAISGDVGNGDCTNDFSNVLVGGKYGCKVANQAVTSYFGRFIPDHFSVVNPVSAWGCSAFTYMDQPFSLTASIEAQNASNTKTQNYAGTFAKGVVTPQAENANNGTALDSRVTFAAPWINGAAAVSATKFARPSTTTADATWGAFDALAIGTTVTDSDAVVLINRDMDQGNTTCTADTAGTSDGNCTATTLATTKFRYGRIRMVNAYGSERLNLPVPLKLEYYAGSGAAQGWQANTLDTCTPVVASNFSFGFPVDVKNKLAACNTALTVTGPAPNYALSLSAPGSAHAGWANVTLNLSAAALGASTQCTAVGGAGLADVPANLSWLQYPVGTNPSARTTFGIYKSPILYRRENY